MVYTNQMAVLWSCIIRECCVVFCRRGFEEGAQFSVLCRILTDQTQPMNNKVKLVWLEYLLELLPSLDSACLKESAGENRERGGGGRGALSSIIINACMYIV